VRSSQRPDELESGSTCGLPTCVAFSVSFENDYLHVLKMLRMAGIPLRAADRGHGRPARVMGGAALFLNPEPLAPFADVIAVGEGEALVPRLLESGSARPIRGRPRRARAKDGFYVPSRLRVAYNDRRHGRALRRPGPVMRQRGVAGQDGAAADGDPHAATPRCP
jgi:radical SAM superfamily enzyme YgiQ (UPF0313 family)